MSTILKALKRLEHEKQAEATRTATHDPLAPELWALHREHAKADGHAMARVALPPRADEALAALFTPYACVPEGVRREPPSAALPPVAANRVPSAVMRLPPQRLHFSALLPGATLAQTLHPSARPCQSQEEMHFRQSLRLR